jgi:signal recognition particle receptor subunit beta
MVQFRPRAREIIAKVVYYGPPLGGKTTNLRTLYAGYPAGTRGELVVVPAGGDRTIFFDFLPVDAGSLRGMRMRVQLYTVPGQVHYNATRQVVLRGVDAVVFVADSQPELMRPNRESWDNLKDNLALQGLSLAELPHVLQYNKRDLQDVVGVEELDDSLNEFNAPFYEAVATEGIGVEETLQGVVKLVARSLRDRFKIPAEAAGAEVVEPVPTAPRPVPPPPPPLRAAPLPPAVEESEAPSAEPPAAASPPSAPAATRPPMPRPFVSTPRPEAVAPPPPSPFAPPPPVATAPPPPASFVPPPPAQRPAEPPLSDFLTLPGPIPPPAPQRPAPPERVAPPAPVPPPTPPAFSTGPVASAGESLAPEPPPLSEGEVFELGAPEPVPLKTGKVIIPPPAPPRPAVPEFAPLGDPFEEPFAQAVGGGADVFQLEPQPAPPRVVEPEIAVEPEAASAADFPPEVKTALVQRVIPRALAQVGEVRELELEVPVPALWTGGKRLTLQFRLTLVPEEDPHAE